MQTMCAAAHAILRLASPGARQALISGPCGLANRSACYVHRLGPQTHQRAAEVVVVAAPAAWPDRVCKPGAALLAKGAAYTAEERERVIHGRCGLWNPRACRIHAAAVLERQLDAAEAMAAVTTTTREN
jgi:hypothetical protein